MRVAYVCADPGVPVFGKKGCTGHVQEVVRSLRSAGAEVDLFATRFDGDPPPDLRAVSIHHLPAAPKGDLAVRELGCLAANEEVSDLLRRNGPFDLVYERYSLWSYAAMEYARESGTPGVLEVNAPLIEEQAAHRGLIHHDDARRVAERAFSAATLLAAVSSGMSDHLLRNYPSTNGRVYVVPNGVNPRRFTPETVPARPAVRGIFTVGFCGNLKPWHGVPVLIKAFAALHRRCPNTRLLVVGEGPERASLEGEILANCLGTAVELTGRVSGDHVPGLLKCMDVATAPYPQMDNFYFSPLKLFEYMASGVPVVASRIGQLDEVIEDGVSGILCSPGDANALADALAQLIDDPPARHRIAAAAREMVLSNYTWDAVIRRVLRLAGVTAADQPAAAEPIAPATAEVTI